MKKLLGLLLFGTMSLGHAASFPCTQAKTSTEKTICNTRSLNDADVKLVTIYNIVLHAVPMGGRDDEKSAQYQWLKKRNTCGADGQCIANAYSIRQQHLDSIINNRVLTQGPF
ncbi:lysozyme inhibitor LprI family protein [Acinetobacter sp. HY1485]|uniref:lysozyme inhibitor LprI family protein n=1 Tax=Acinetobacter sp. HY1485 TaxID=2970918 RepID=UPI0022B94986|nr:hypothetical protein [Acinetobacter sp. HY1485]